MKIDDRLLTQALINSNNRFVENIPSEMETHNFSRRFERRMRHLILADKKYGGNLWLEKIVSYSVKAAAIILCLLSINYVSVKAFDFNIWNAIITKTGEFLNINFEETKEDIIGTKSVRFKIVNVPDGYTQQEEYRSENMSVQHFTAEKGTITYTESLISETADINIESGRSVRTYIKSHEVNCIMAEDSITAFFTDDKSYHIVEIQGADANQEFVEKIIEELEEQ